MIEEIDASRRGFFQILGTAVTVGGLMTPAIAQESRETAKKREVKATPPEDLMREHGVLDRVLLIYEAAMRKFSEGEDFDPGILTNSAQIVRDFIENYHEKSEEEAVFPRFKKAGKMVDLVDYLLSQHLAGRTVTDTIFKLVPTSRKESEDRRQLVSSMCRPTSPYTGRTPRERTRTSSRSSRMSSPRTNTTPWLRTSRRRNTLYSATTAARKWSTGWQSWNKQSASGSRPANLWWLSASTFNALRAKRPRRLVFAMTRLFVPAAAVERIGAGQIAGKRQTANQYRPAT